jgi:adenylate kinase family enzyme
MERLRVFGETTRPVCEYYEKKGLLQLIHGSDETEDVYNQIVGVLV